MMDFINKRMHWIASGVAGAALASAGVSLTNPEFYIIMACIAVSYIYGEIHGEAK